MKIIEEVLAGIGLGTVAFFAPYFLFSLERVPPKQTPAAVVFSATSSPSSVKADKHDRRGRDAVTCDCRWAKQK